MLVSGSCDQLYSVIMKQGRCSDQPVSCGFVHTHCISVCQWQRFKTVRIGLKDSRWSITKCLESREVSQMVQSWRLEWLVGGNPDWRSHLLLNHYLHLLVDVVSRLSTHHGCNKQPHRVRRVCTLFRKWRWPIKKDVSCCCKMSYLAPKYVQVSGCVAGSHLTFCTANNSWHSLSPRLRGAFL